mmetsp:Transcript_88727/g.231615  ORF Transcript_88727/g.231615 Transcript_88727/m.231615 type:complete len:298 (-) Transcript_88727:195-1088(-)
MHSVGPTDRESSAITPSPGWGLCSSILSVDKPPHFRHHVGGFARQCRPGRQAAFLLVWRLPTGFDGTGDGAAVVCALLPEQRVAPGAADAYAGCRAPPFARAESSALPPRRPRIRSEIPALDGLRHASRVPRCRRQNRPERHAVKAPSAVRPSLRVAVDGIQLLLAAECRLPGCLRDDCPLPNFGWDGLCDERAFVWGASDFPEGAGHWAPDPRLHAGQWCHRRQISQQYCVDGFGRWSSVCFHGCCRCSAVPGALPPPLRPVEARRALPGVLRRLDQRLACPRDPSAALPLQLVGL